MRWFRSATFGLVQRIAQQACALHASVTGKLQSLHTYMLCSCTLHIAHCTLHCALHTNMFQLRQSTLESKRVDTAAEVNVLCHEGLAEELPVSFRLGTLLQIQLSRALQRTCEHEMLQHRCQHETRQNTSCSR